MLGCTDRRAELGIHRTQAGGRGIRLGRGHWAEACCSTTTSPIDSTTSATASGRSAAGLCRRPQCGRAVPPGLHHPVSARAENPSPPPLAAAAVRARCPSVSAPGHRCGPGAMPRPRLLRVFAWVKEWWANGMGEGLDND